MAGRPAEAPRRPAQEVVAELRRALQPWAPKRGAEGAPPIPTGLVPLDEALGGGLPRGRLVEIAGEAGRMACCLGALAGATQRGLCAALVDVPGAADPRELKDAGVDLQRLLWVGPTGGAAARDALRAADLLVEADGFGLVVLFLGGGRPPSRLDHAFARLVQRCERSGVALLLLTDQPLGGSSPAVTLSLRRGPARWSQVPGGRLDLSGQGLFVEVTRSRLGPPPPPRAWFLPR